MSRHDAQRTGASTQRAEIPRPAPRWRRYLGGSVDALLAIDAAPRSEGREVVFVAGGRLVARRADDAPLWQTPLLGLRSIVAQLDFDGDGTDELLVTGSPGFLGVFSSLDGSLRWSAQGGELFGVAVGAVRIADLDGDGTREVYAADAACGAGGADRAHVFSFARGFGSGQPDALTQRTSLVNGRDYPCGVHDVVIDLEGDGRPEVLTFGSAHAYVFDGATGRKRDSGLPAPALGGYALGFTLPYGQVTTHVVDVDGDGREELVGLTNNGFEPSINSRQLFVLAWDPARPAATRLVVRWRQRVPSVVTDRHVFAPQVVTDLDGDLRPELVSAFSVASMGAPPVPTTFVYGASDGAVLATIPGVQPQGVLARTGSSGPVLLAARDGALEGYRFARFAGAPVPSPRFRVTDAQVLTWRDPQQTLRDDGGTQPISWSLADGTNVFFTMNVARTRLSRWDLSVGDRVARTAVLELAPATLLSVAP